MTALGFVSAILPDLTLDEVLRFAGQNGFTTVELMCWPSGKADRRYAGVTHLDVTDFSQKDCAPIHNQLRSAGVSISALGYYPNPLVADETESGRVIEHLKKVISAASLLGVQTVTTFVGRDHTRSVKENWALFDRRWPSIIEHAEKHRVRIAIENCPMLFTDDEWPGGKNLAASPAIWREMFRRIPSSSFGLNYDPSHLIWQMMDPIKPLSEFVSRIFHVHAKDASIDRDALDDVGILATPLEYHQPRIPGRGSVPWDRFLAELRQVNYDGPICIEVEDRAYEGTLEGRQQALRESSKFLRQFLKV